MTKNFTDLITLLSAAIAENDNIDVSEFCFSDIYTLAKSQQIQTIVFPVIKKLKDSGKVLIEEELYKKWERSFFKSIAFSFQRNQYMSSFIKRLEDQKIKNCILKGVALSELYLVPDSRVSSDVDLLIPEKSDLGTVVEMLKNDGFYIGEILDGSHQIECHHPRYGLIEIHTDICDEIARTVWFENSVKLSVDFTKKEDGLGGFYYTLPETDGAVYITFHFLKHFLSHGCGLRQLSDMLLYLKKYEYSIDWGKFNSLFSGLNYLKFIDRCKDIGNRYFGMDFVVGESDEDLCRAVLTDMEGGGVFGYDEDYRKSFTYYYTKQRSFSASHSKLRIKSFLARGVSFAKERQYNIVLIIKDYIHKKNKETASLPEINERLELFRNLGFFDK